MQRRTKAILLIAFGILVILGVLWWLFWPNAEQTPEPFNQPPGYTDTQAQPVIEPEPAAPAPVPADPALIESRRLEDRLRRMAQDFVSRAGSYSNADEFAALREAGLEATTDVRTFFAAEHTRLMAAHPFRSGSWGQTTRGLASKITSPTPIRDQTTVTIEVQAQVVTEVGEAAPETSYQNVTVTFEKSGTSWLVSRILWSERP